MKTRVTLMLCFLLASFLFSRRAATSDIPDLPDATSPISGALIVPKGTGVHILFHHGEWSSFFSTGGEGEPFFLIGGGLKNTSGKSLT